MKDINATHTLPFSKLVSEFTNFVNPQRKCILESRITIKIPIFQTIFFTSTILFLLRIRNPIIFIEAIVNFGAFSVMIAPRSHLRNYLSIFKLSMIAVTLPWKCFINTGSVTKTFPS